MKIGFVGLGIMGKSMSLNLLKAGIDLTVWNRTKEKVTALQDQGANVADSLGTLAQNSDIIITIVNDTPDVEEIIFGRSGLITSLSPGKIIIDMSTISPDATERLANKLREKQIEMLDAPVSGGVKGAIDGSLTFIVGGSEKAVMKAGPVFGAMGKSVFRVGDVGTGMTLKALNQIISALNTLTICETVVLGEKLGVSAERFYEVLSHCAANSYHLQSKLPDFIIPKSFDTGHRIEMMIKDLDIALDIANQNNVDMKFSRTGTDLYREGAENGYAKLDISSMSVYLSGKSK